MYIWGEVGGGSGEEVEGFEVGGRRWEGSEVGGRRWAGEGKIYLCALTCADSEPLYTIGKFLT